jgi:hypothetical protein
MTVKVLDLKNNRTGPNADAGCEADGVETLSQVRDSYYKQVARKIRQDASLLVQKVQERDELTRYDELVEVIQASGEVSILLWAQKAQTKWIKSDTGGKFIFDNASQSVKAHSCMYLENGDRGYDGRRIQLVIEPAIYAFGNEYGKNYDQGKLRLPAIVWLSKEDPEQPTPSLGTATEGPDLLGKAAGANGSNGDVDDYLERAPKRQKIGPVSEIVLQWPSVQPIGRMQQNVVLLAEHIEGIGQLSQSEEYSEDAETASSTSSSLSEPPAFLAEDKKAAASLSADAFPSPSHGGESEAARELWSMNIEDEPAGSQDGEMSPQQDCHDTAPLRKETDQAKKDEAPPKDANGQETTQTESASDHDVESAEAGTFEVSMYQISKRFVHKLEHVLTT